MKVRTFKDLLVWKKAHALVLEVYKATQAFPKEEQFGLVAQIRRSASSIPTNIVEGQKRNSTKDCLHFLNMSDASLEETKYLLILSRDLSYLDGEASERISILCDEVGRLLSALQRSRRRDLQRPHGIVTFAFQNGDTMVTKNFELLKGSLPS